MDDTAKKNRKIIAIGGAVGATTGLAIAAAASAFLGNVGGIPLSAALMGFGGLYGGISGMSTGVFIASKKQNDAMNKFSKKYFGTSFKEIDKKLPIAERNGAEYYDSLIRKQYNTKQLNRLAR